MLELDRALQIADESLEGGVDWLEAGTPLIKSEGMNAVRALRDKYPEATIVADMKTMDTGAMEVEMAAKSGANVVAILGAADDTTIEDALRAANKYGVRIMTDLIGVENPVERVKRLVDLGVDIIGVHVGIDQQMAGKDTLDLLQQVLAEVDVTVAAAGGLDATTAGEAVARGADIVIVGGNIVRSADVRESAHRIRNSIDSPESIEIEKRDLDEEIRELLGKVSTPNISDAMHRKGAMNDLRPLCPGLKMIGRAVTVQTFGGDWAKAVEAIDRAGPGDVIVINNSSDRTVAPWGELATLSCKVKGVEGVVVDGAVRDVDDIKEMNYPVFSTAQVPNAGEPKGMGEIDAEITCCGQAVRPGDYIVGDDSGVVVVPRERAYEVARRAMEVWKNEDRVREEIRRGKTLAEVMDLYKWEKK